jgi:hypothetical protein
MNGQRFEIVLEDRDDITPVIVRLRELLKIAGRGLRLKCIEARQLGDRSVDVLGDSIIEQQEHDADLLLLDWLAAARSRVDGQGRASERVHGLRVPLMGVGGVPVPYGNHRKTE